VLKQVSKDLIFCYVLEPNIQIGKDFDNNDVSASEFGDKDAVSLCCVKQTANIIVLTEFNEAVNLCGDNF
jgi:hypothetical protein